MNPLLKIPYLRLKYRFFPNKAQAFWGQELLNSQGISAKIGQVLAQGKDAELPKSTIKIPEAKALFQKKFNRDVSITSEAIAASMGQVFTASLEGNTYAVKLLHPGIKDSLKKEIKNLLLLGTYFAKAKKFSFDVPTFERFLSEVFEEETNLVREALFQQKFSELFAEDARFKIPAVIKEFSDEDLLCQEWVVSTVARDLTRFPGFEVFEFFFHSLLTAGVLHGDLNDRNWGITPEQKVVVFDYGCSQIVSSRRINGFKKLVLNRDIKNAFREFGIRLEATSFYNKEQELRDALFAPFTDSRLAPDWSYSKDLEAKFGDRIKALREFTDPWVLLMMRSLFSLIRVYQDRRIPIPLRDLLTPYLGLKNDPNTQVEIHIEILKDGKQTFFFKLPFTSLKEIEMHIPMDVREKIKSEGVDLRTILREAHEKGAVSQDVFDVKVEEKRYRVWLA